MVITWYLLVMEEVRKLRVHNIIIDNLVEPNMPTIEITIVPKIYS